VSVLLDGTVLAALVIAEHEHHERAAAWFASLDGFAVCPQTEAALLRFLIRLGESPATALAVLAGVRAHPGCEFWTADASHVDLDAADLGDATQLSEAYLAALAVSRGDRLATLDAATAERLGARATLVG
jgi:predicted nucleic acid-binding protein